MSQILKTVDGGQNWFLQCSGGGDAFNAVYFTDAASRTTSYCNLFHLLEKTRKPKYTKRQIHIHKFKIRAG